MTKPMTGTIAALDIGTSKVACFIADATGDGAPRIAGIGHHAAAGMRAGAITDMEAATSGILAAVSAAEQMAGQRIREVIVNVSSGRPRSRRIDADISIGGREVGENDLRRLIGSAPPFVNGDGGELVHCIPTGFSIDGRAGIREPRGLHGDRLGVGIHVVTAGSAAMRNLLTCVERCHLEVSAAVVAPYASGLAALAPDESSLGATLVDMGGGTTTIAIFREGEAVHTDWIPVGGQHVTSDIARGLSTPLAHAERLKTLYGNAIATAEDDQEVIDVPLIGEDSHAASNHVPRSMLNRIIQPRLEETFELVRERIEMSGAAGLAGRRLVLTGGASQLQGVRELAGLILEKQVRLGRPKAMTGLADSAAGPAFSTAAGLLLFGAEGHDDVRDWGRAPAGLAAGRWGRVGQWLRENF